MKSINFLLIIAAFLFTANTGFAQSAKANGKAVEKTNKLDEQIKSENPALALSETQKEQIVALQAERMSAINAFKKSNSDKEAVKAKSKELNKALNAKINGEILTAEQAQAIKNSRKKTKGQKGKGGAKAKKPAGKKAMSPAASITMAEVDKILTAASAKQKARAEKSTEKLNASIIAADANLALSADQRKQMNALAIKDSLEQKEMKDAGATEEEMKMKKKSNRKMINSILTKEQKAARKTAKK